MVGRAGVRGGGWLGCGCDLVGRGIGVGGDGGTEEGL